MQPFSLNRWLHRRRDRDLCRGCSHTDAADKQGRGIGQLSCNGQEMNVDMTPRKSKSLLCISSASEVPPLINGGTPQQTLAKTLVAYMLPGGVVHDQDAKLNVPSSAIGIARCCTSEGAVKPITVTARRNGRESSIAVKVYTMRHTRINRHESSEKCRKQATEDRIEPHCGPLLLPLVRCYQGQPRQQGTGGRRNQPGHRRGQCCSGTMLCLGKRGALLASSILTYSLQLPKDTEFN